VHQVMQRWSGGSQRRAPRSAGPEFRLPFTSILAELMAGPKRQWASAVEAVASENYPGWRDLFQKTGRRLPLEKRKELEPRSAWQPRRPDIVKALLDWLGVIAAGHELIAQVSKRLDAMLEFTIFVTREFLLRNYSLEKHQSDVFDQFQLQYLAMDRFVIVSRDPDLSRRTLECIFRWM
jgi:hypothetical protein